MKLIELEIRNIRGIKEVLLRPEGENLVIWGGNGVGKSAVVDAIDFLLTKKISRLTGKGTGGITLSKHGPHIGSTPDESWVRAKIKLSESGEEIEVSRSMDAPEVLKGGIRSDLEHELQNILKLALRGQHVLTRREILKFVTADGNTRLQEIQELLNISQIEDIRLVLTKAKNNLKKEKESCESNYYRSQNDITSTIREFNFNEKRLLDVVNQQRTILLAPQITEIKTSEIKSGLAVPALLSKTNSINTTIFERDILGLTELLSHTSKQEVDEKKTQLTQILSEIEADPTLLMLLKQRKLLELGMDLLGDSSSCPLCDIKWEAGELKHYLDDKWSKAVLAAAYETRINDTLKWLQQKASVIGTTILKIITVSEQANLGEHTKLLKSWQRDLRAFIGLLSDETKKYEKKNFDFADVNRFFAPEGVFEELDSLNNEVVSRYPKLTPEQTAWDMLTTLETQIRVYEREVEALKISVKNFKRAEIVLGEFERARDLVLKDLYEEVKDSFVNLYKQMHGEDEKNFSAVIQSSKAAIDLEVDFYEKGTHPPHALHSEGHQDSMGLCLYLAFAEKLTRGIIDLVILDDVVMSVDANHRRELCRVLKDNFPDRQFLITTHDQVWAEQLRTEGIVKRKGMTEFFNWNIETGPCVNEGKELWQKIQGDLMKSDVPSAAARLRRGSEFFFSEVCEKLTAEIRYKSDGRWDLGDLSKAARSRFKEILKLAKKSADSWSKNELSELIESKNKEASDLFEKADIEQWVINGSVHYSNWLKLNTREFQPVVEAFKNMFSLFVCDKCNVYLYVTFEGMTADSLRCRCAEINWPLNKK